jgi:2-keto-myo-inositol isomerase
MRSHRTRAHPMKPCISQATTLNNSFENDLTAYRAGGWSAVELWLTKLETFLESHRAVEARELLTSSGLKPAAAAAQGGLLLSQGTERTAHWDHFRRRLVLLQELGVPTLIVTPDFARQPALDDYSRAAARLAEAAVLAASFGVRIALEFQKTSLFCSCLETTLALISQSGSTNVGVCFDVFHYYTGPSKFEDLMYLSPANLAWVHVCDVSSTPRELASDGDRIFPGEGDFQLGPIIDHLGQIRYDGYVSLEVFNQHLWQVAADRVADLGFRALGRVLGSWRSPQEARGGS